MILLNRKLTAVAIIGLTAFTLVACGKKDHADVENSAAKKHEENVVTLTKENLEHAQIKTELVTLGSIAITLKAPGRVSENLNNTAKIASTLEGRLVKLDADLNDRVKAGDVLALVQTPELLGRPLELKAPIDGVIIKRNSAPGELAGKDKEIYTISDPTDLWVIAEIKERDAGAVKIGQEATFTVLSYAGERFGGKVVRVGNEIERESRTLKARIEVDNSDGRLKPGMFADVEITTNVLKDALVISDAALQTEEASRIVFVALDTNKFQKRVVKLGLEHQGKVQVLEGLKEGEKAVTDGSFILKSEMLKGEMEAD